MTIQELARAAREMIDAISRHTAKDWDRYKTAKLRLQDMIVDVLGPEGEIHPHGLSKPNQPVPNLSSLQTLAKRPGNTDRCGSTPQQLEELERIEFFTNQAAPNADSLQTTDYVSQQANGTRAV